MSLETTAYALFAELPEDVRHPRLTADQVDALQELREQILATIDNATTAIDATLALAYQRGAPQGTALDCRTPTPYLTDHEREAWRHNAEQATDAERAGKALIEWRQHSGWDEWTAAITGEFFNPDGTLIA